MKNWILSAAILLVVISCQNPAPYFPGDTWETISPEEAGIDPEKLDKAMAWLESQCGENGISEVVVVKDGYIVYRGSQAERRHNIWSCTKSFTGMALGLLQQDGKCTLEDYARLYAPFLEENYPLATLRHFTTMTSGYNAVGQSRWGEQSDDWSWTPFTPDTPLFLPGNAFCYWDEAMMTLGYALTAAAGRDMKELLDERIFQPIGAGAWHWGDEPSGLGITVRNGCTGIELNALQLARIGYLVLNKGNCNGPQLMDSQWIAVSTRNQVPAEISLAETDRKNIDGRGNYGYNWWTNGTVSGGKPALPGMPAGTHYMSGHNNNVCFIVPEWNLVLVRMGTDGNPPAGKAEVYSGFFRKLMEG